MPDVTKTETSEETSDDIPKSIANPAWADVMQKILKSNKPKKKKSLVLSKAKKLQDVLKEKTEDDGDEDENKESTEKIKSKVTEESNEKIHTQRKTRRKDGLGIRVKPSILDKEYERTLQRIATKGVVQLFNAVRQQQSEINRKIEEAGPLERKREQVYKEVNKQAFLDVLMGGSKSIPVDKEVKPEKSIKKQENESKLWSVLRDDFVMGAKLKDWDKKNEDSEDSSDPEEMEIDD